ncbi:hypothetical protein ACODT5_44815 [Streptomyces sp. 5.8]|uniref:hypothetical protein n=1 Tax=Streptomyces sp. 5.8 TaxID=3406571 RepID=UPI003BB6D202
MNTFLDYLAVLAVAALLLAPALYGATRDRRIDQQIRAAAERRAGRAAVIRAPDPASGSRSSRGAGPSASSLCGSASASMGLARLTQACIGPRSAAR